MFLTIVTKNMTIILYIVHLFQCLNVTFRKNLSASIIRYKRRNVPPTSVIRIKEGTFPTQLDDSVKETSSL
jgi:hypothetical protein